MKLVIQIPCFNEEDNILEVLKNIPKKFFGVDKTKIVVLDDCSSDNTVNIAKSFGVDIISSNNHIGLAKLFMLGVDYALKEKADILVNLDGDNQYLSLDIEKIIKPIIDKKADIVVGSRPIDEIRTFSTVKKNFQKLGTNITKLMSGVDVKDAASGFRAFSKEALLRLNIFNDFSYTIESIIQAKTKNLILENVDIRVNAQKNRHSKLFKNNLDYIIKQTKNILRFFVVYKPYKFFSIVSYSMLFIGLILGLRFLYYYFTGFGSGHIQSLILCAIIMTLCFISYMIAILGELLSINRKILEDIQYNQRQEKYKK